MNHGNANRGEIWPNNQKEKDSQPDFKGTLNVKGEKFWISAWKREGGTNPDEPSLSITVQSKDEATLNQPKDYIVEADNP